MSTEPISDHNIQFCKDASRPSLTGNSGNSAGEASWWYLSCMQAIARAEAAEARHEEFVSAVNETVPKSMMLKIQGRVLKARRAQP